MKAGHLKERIGETDMASFTILIADDSITDLKLLQFLLSKQAAYHLQEVRNGQDTLDAVRANPELDLLLLDVHLPDLSGIQVCRQLKEDPVTAQVPIVLISAVRTDAADIAEGLSAGADGYLTKPIDENALEAWVKAALRLRSLQRTLAHRTVTAPQDELETLGIFGKLSHAVNNPLQTIMATSDLLSMDIEEGTEAEAPFREINAACERIAELTAHASHLARERLKFLDSH